MAASDRFGWPMTPFAPGIFSGEGAETRLIASRCASSGRLDYPAIASGDGDPCEPVELSPLGILYSFTAVRMKPPFGLPSPYATAYVDLAEGLRVFALLDPLRIGDYRIGMKLVLTSGELGTGLAGEPCTRPYFAPAED